MHPEKIIENQILTSFNNVYPKKFSLFKTNNTGIWDTEKKIFRKNKSRFIPMGRPDIDGWVHSSGPGHDFTLPVYIEVKTEKIYNYIIKHWAELKNYYGSDKDKNRYKSQIIFLSRAIDDGCIAFFTHSLEHAKKTMDFQLELKLSTYSKL